MFCVFRAFVRPSVCDCVRACMQKSFLAAQYLTNKLTEFHRTLVDDVVQVDTRNDFEGFEGQVFKVKVATKSDVKTSGSYIS